jgi:hypothetical protein
VVSHVCDQCGATVAADEQFCPSCGSFIDPLKTAAPPPPSPPRPTRPRPAGHVISVSSDGNYEEFTLEEPEPEPLVAPPSGGNRGGGSVDCPSCGTSNPSTNLHCQNCGARLRQGPLPTAPRPAVQATAGVRAALAISGLLLIVILVALAFNIFSDNAAGSTTTTLDSTTTSSTTPMANAPIPILSTVCDPPGLGSFSCSNLTSGDSSEYQVNWEELEQAESPLVIRLSFSQPMIVERIDWTNISDETRFLQNHRAMGITIDGDNQLVPFSTNLDDSPGTQIIRYAAINANYIEITVHSTYRSQVVGDRTFPEIAIDEIVVIGRPAAASGG